MPGALPLGSIRSRTAVARLSLRQLGFLQNRHYEFNADECRRRLFVDKTLGQYLDNYSTRRFCKVAVWTL